MHVLQLFAWTAYFCLKNLQILGRRIKLVKYHAFEIRDYALLVQTFYFTCMACMQLVKCTFNIQCVILSQEVTSYLKSHLGHGYWWEKFQIIYLEFSALFVHGNINT